MRPGRLLPGCICTGGVVKQMSDHSLHSRRAVMRPGKLPPGCTIFVWVFLDLVGMALVTILWRLLNNL